MGSGGNDLLQADAALVASSGGASGVLLLTSKAKSLNGAEIQTLRSYGYGYYEVNMKVASVAGVCDSFFWIESPNYGPHEIDVEFLTNESWLSSANSGVVHFTLHPSEQTFVQSLPFNPSRAFHRYGFLWTAGKVAFTVDGQAIHSFTDPQLATNAVGYIMMNTWTGNPNWGGGPPAQDATTAYDWVAFYQGATSIPVSTPPTPPATDGGTSVPADGGTHAPVDAGTTLAGWPGPSNTGVPAGTTLTNYTGPCTLTTAGTVIDSKNVTCDLVVQAANVTIKNSKVTGLVVIDVDLAGSSGWSLTVQDSEVNGGQQQRAVVSDGNMTILRSNIYGGETAVHCSEHATSCKVQDSYLHGQNMPQGVDWHLGGFQSNGGTNIQLVHNFVICDAPVNDQGAGCTGDINLIPDFAVVSHVTVDHNLLGANADAAYCTYGGDKSTSPYAHADHVVYTNNVFQRGTNSKCDAYGPVTGFNLSGVGNQWSNNTWADDGTPVAPED